MEGFEKDFKILQFKWSTVLMKKYFLNQVHTIYNLPSNKYSPKSMVISIEKQTQRPYLKFISNKNCKVDPSIIILDIIKMCLAITDSTPWRKFSWSLGRTN